MIPEMQENIKYITMKLSENERANDGTPHESQGNHGQIRRDPCRQQGSFFSYALPVWKPGRRKYWTEPMEPATMELSNLGS